MLMTICMELTKNKNYITNDFNITSIIKSRLNSHGQTLHPRLYPHHPHKSARVRL